MRIIDKKLIDKKVREIYLENIKDENWEWGMAYASREEYGKLIDFLYLREPTIGILEWFGRPRDITKK